VSTSTGWAVSLDIEGQPLTAAQIDTLVDTLDAAVGHADTRTTTTITAHGATVEDALRDACRRVSAALADLTPKPRRAWRIVRAEVRTDAELDAELARPTYPEVVGVAEAAEILGVSRQRASKLLERLDPVARLAAGPIWRADAVRTFGAVQRRPGRPSKAS
jgi:hypothetical protein